MTKIKDLIIISIPSILTLIFLIFLFNSPSRFINHCESFGGQVGYLENVTCSLFQERCYIYCNLHGEYINYYDGVHTICIKDCQYITKTTGQACVC